MSIKREARNVPFFWVSRSLFPEHRFKRFLQWHVFKWPFAELNEEILIGKQRFLLVFAESLMRGSFLP